MNLHVPQTLAAQAEAREIMAVRNQIVSAQSNQPVMGVIQDTMISMYLLTQPHVRLSKADFFACVVCIPRWDGTFCVDVDNETFRGHDLVSMALPDVNWKGYGVVIRKGILLRGQLTKKVLGTGHGSLIHVIHNDCGPGEACLFIHRLQCIGHHYLSMRGFTFSIADIVCSNENNAYVHDQCDKAFASIEHDANELKINGVLNACRDTVGVAVQKDLTQDNNLFCLVNSGTKGKPSNISQIMAVVGQQNLNGKRMPNNWHERTLTHFPQGDISPAAKGFIQHSYVEGLTPAEAWFAAVAGREGIIDTACKTAQVGYIQRKMVKPLADLVSKWDGSVRNADGTMMQFAYGDDAINALTVEKQHIYEFETLKLSKCIKKEYEQLMKDKAYLERIDVVRDPIYQSTAYWMLPVPVDRIIDNVQGTGKRMTKTNIYKAVTKTIASISNELMQAFLRIKLNSCKLFFDIKVTPEQLEKILNDIEVKWEMARITSGESVGCLAAQSIGEFITQMTLNTFHNAGNSSFNVTLGIPRMLEIINSVKHISTPYATFSCKRPEEAHRMLYLRRLQDVVNSYKVTDTPDATEVESYYVCPDIGHKQSKLPSTLVLYLREWHDVTAIKRCLPATLTCAYTEGPRPIFHIQALKKTNLGHLYETSLRKLLISGKEGGERVDIVEKGDELVVETSFTDMQAIWEAGGSKITTNDIHEVYRTLGIEAARRVIISELRSILAFYGLYVNARHILLLVDWMCSTGKIIPLTRHGLKEIDTSPLKLATFEEIVNVFFQSAFLQKTDELLGTNERIMVGAPAKIGTNDGFEVVNDWELFHKYRIDPPIEDVEIEDPWIQDSSWMQEPDDPFVGGGGFGQMGGMGGMGGMAPTVQHLSAWPVPQNFAANVSVYPPPFSTTALPAMTQNPPSPADDPNGNFDAFLQSCLSPKAPEYAPGSPTYDPNSPGPRSPSYDPNSPTDLDEGLSYGAQAYDPLRDTTKTRKTYFESPTME